MLATVLALAVIAWRGRSDVIAAGNAVARTREVIGEIFAVRAAVLSSETNERAYIITGDEAYLELHRQAAASLDTHLDRLAAISNRDISELRKTVLDRREALRHGSELRRQQGFEAARQWVVEGHGHRIMTKLLALITDLADGEERDLADRLARVDAAARQARVTFATLVVAAAVFLIGAAVITRREMAQRGHAQAEAQHQAMTLRLVLDSVGEGISVANADGSLLTVNRAGEQMLGRRESNSPPEKWSREFGVFYPDGSEIPPEETTIMRALKGEASDDVEWLLRNEKFPEGVVISASGRPIRDARGRITGAVSVFRDISARKRHEGQLKEAMLKTAAINRELEAFSYSVAHDLRAPLRAIDGFSQALLEDYAAKLDDQGRDYLGRVRSAAQRMGALIDDLLELSRLSRSEMKLERVNLSELAGDVAGELARREPQRSVDVRIATGLSARGDSRLLRVALTNLIGNAWKFTSKKPGAHIELGAQNGSFFVRDDGVGFDMAYADKLFGAFQRLHDRKDFEGTGVGLATVARIIHRHGGRVWAESAPGNGATFYFTLPAEKST